jgi:hypothetical protein
MRLKSKGLGKKELVMDFREYTVVREGDELVVVGTIRDPINWDFTIRMCEDDLAGLVALGANRSVFGLVMRWLSGLMRWLFGARPKHHWTQERDEHLAEGKKRLLAAQADAQEKAVAAMKPPPLHATKRRRRLPASRQVEKLDCPLSGKRCEITFVPGTSANGSPAKPRDVLTCSSMADPSKVDCSKACLEARSSAA